MAIVPILHGDVSEDGSALVWFSGERNTRRAHLKSLAGKPVDIVIRRHRDKRSLDQNAYWWAVPVQLLAEHCGYHQNQMHYVLLGECFGYVVGPTGRDIPNVTSSSALSVDEFTRLIEWVLIWGPTEMQVDIPPPQEVAA